MIHINPLAFAVIVKRGSGMEGEGGAGELDGHGHGKCKSVNR